MTSVKKKVAVTKNFLVPRFVLRFDSLSVNITGNVLRLLLERERGE